MRTAIKACISILLAALISVGPAAAQGLAHDEFMPPDRYAARQDRPDQMLLEVQRHRLTVGVESRPAASGKTQEASLWLFLEGRALLQGSSMRSVRVGFVGDAESLPPARYEHNIHTLTLFYPMRYFPVVTSLLAAPGPHYVQARFYANGTVWADIHAGPVTAR